MTLICPGCGSAGRRVTQRGIIRKQSCDLLDATSDFRRPSSTRRPAIAEVVSAAELGPDPFAADAPVRYLPWSATTSDASPAGREPVAAAQRDTSAPAVVDTTEPDDPFEPSDRPRVVDGIIVPARCAADYLRRAIYAPASALKTVGTTSRGVGFYTAAGQWHLLWVGDDQSERDDALAAFLRDLGAHARRRP